MINRRNLLISSAAGLLTGSINSQAQTHTNHQKTAPIHTSSIEPPQSITITAQDYQPVITPNVRILPYRLNDGVKEFHLIAEEVEHEFAPGNKIKAWGYNGSTPGPTIEAVEGDHLRIYVTNKLPENTTLHWHGILVPWGMDGIKGLTQPAIQPGETYVYEFTLRQHGTHMYHPHADEMVQMAMGLMGLFIIHPKEVTTPKVDRDYAILLHNWAVHPGTYRPDPSVMSEFDLWTMNSKVFPAIEPLIAQTGERVRIRIGNLSMWNHPMHLHGVQFEVTGSDGGRWPQNQWRKEVTEIVGVGQTRDIEFTAVPGDWALHCHMSHHTMNAMGHGIHNMLGVKQPEEQINKVLPNYMAMGETGMSSNMNMDGPINTLPMMMGNGRFGNIEMGGMFTLVKVRDNLEGNPNWFSAPEGTSAKKVLQVPIGVPV